MNNYSEIYTQELMKSCDGFIERNNQMIENFKVEK